MRPFPSELPIGNHALQSLYRKDPTISSLSRWIAVMYSFIAYRRVIRGAVFESKVETQDWLRLGESQ